MTKLIITDLDDTLYPEINFTYSGFRSVSDYLSNKHNLNSKDLFNFLQKSFANGARGNNFNLLLEKFSIKEDLNYLINLFRKHKPQISLYPDAKKILDYLKLKQILLVLMTDGYLVTQKNKIDALNIKDYFDKIIINDISKGKDKSDQEIYIDLINKMRINLSDITFIGDNPRKDFKASLKLGIQSVRIIRKEGIYRQEQDIEKPDFTITTLDSIKKIINY